MESRALPQSPRSPPQLLPGAAPKASPPPLNMSSTAPPRSPLATENSPSGKLPRPAMACWLPAANSRQMLPQSVCTICKTGKIYVEHVWHFMESHPFFPGMPELFPRINFTDLPHGQESYKNFMGLIELNSGTKITFPFTATFPPLHIPKVQSLLDS